MTDLSQERFPENAPSSPRRSWGLLNLLHGAGERTRTVTVVAVAIAWIPPAALSLVHGTGSLRSFLTDYASQSRFLVILPVLILAVPGLNRCLDRVVQHLEQFVPEDQSPAYQADWASFKRLSNSRIAQSVIVLISYAALTWLAISVRPEGAEVVDWWKGGAGFHWFSPAGTWTLFVSYPILAFYTLLWLWRQLLWVRFMRAAAGLKLRLIAAHPDSLGGLGFIESALCAQQPFSFCLGAAFAGAVANRIFHHGEKLSSFAEVAAVLFGLVLLICVLPYFVFTPALALMRRGGLLKYGGFARSAGEHFEQKWLAESDRLNQDVLMVADFSAIHNLYGVVGNVNNVSVLPVTRVDLYGLFAAAFAPFLPVVIASVPLAVVARAVIKMLI